MAGPATTSVELSGSLPSDSLWGPSVDDSDRIVSDDASLSVSTGTRGPRTTVMRGAPELRGPSSRMRGCFVRFCIRSTFQHQNSCTPARGIRTHIWWSGIQVRYGFMALFSDPRMSPGTHVRLNGEPTSTKTHRPVRRRPDHYAGSSVGMIVDKERPRR